MIPCELKRERGKRRMSTELESAVGEVQKHWDWKNVLGLWQLRITGDDSRSYYPRPAGDPW